MWVRQADRSVEICGSRRGLLQGVSLAALGVLLGAQPAQAQLASFRLGTTAPVVTPSTTTVRPVTMRDALSRSVEHQVQSGAIRSYVSEARAAALAAVRIAPADGLAANGLDPVKDAVQAALDATGLKSWQGASAPSQSTDSAGKTLVLINQTDSRALLTWNNFDIGANTTLQFNQKRDGVAQTSWVAVNRVVNGVAPSTILGAIKADGTVVVLNQRGVIFGATAQVDLHSLLASSLELGNFASKQTFIVSPDTYFSAASVQQRNLDFLQNGLLVEGAAGGVFSPMLTSSLAAEGSYRADAQGGAAALNSAAAEGDVIVDRGAKITATAGGFIILTAPKIANDGALSAAEGQVGLQTGRAVSYTASTGSAAGDDPNVRGLVLRTAFGARGSVLNSGLIEAQRGYISLGADLLGSVTNNGLLAATTSVSRNGKIALTAGTISLGGAAIASQASGITIAADASTESVPQGTAAEPAAFKTSKIDIGGYYGGGIVASTASGQLGPAQISFGANSLLLAPNADVDVGGRAGTVFSSATYRNLFNAMGLVASGDPLGIGIASGIDIASGAVIDVSGIKDWQLDASRNTLVIAPAKRNELRDTPNYRESTTNGDFTLNGATIYVDPRISGVRSDGVAWIGSPLIEAGSAYSQVGVTAGELMTRGGNLNLAVGLVDDPLLAATAPKITIARDAVIDFSGGWVRYADGIVRTSKLLTADGRVVDISKADPNDEYVAIGDGFTEVQAKFGISRTYANSLLQGGVFQQGFDEGRDAGSLIISASTLALNGTLHGDAFAGRGQTAAAQTPTGASAITGDTRKLQATRSQLPSGGYLKLGSFTGKTGSAFGADINIFHGDAPAATSSATIALSDTTLSNARLSALKLQTSGAITLASDSALTLANGGGLTLDAGRSITLNGDVTAPAGMIAARTYDLGGTGSPFRSDDEYGLTIATGDNLARFDALYDINVAGTLSTAGNWINDFGLSEGEASGSAWTKGGSISLTVAPRVFVAIGDTRDGANDAADLSGSIRITPTALLNVASGGYVGASGALNLTASGGNIALINETTYASISKSRYGNNDIGLPDSIDGTVQSVTFSPLPYSLLTSGTLNSALVPTTTSSEVSFVASNLKGFGFGGGGNFTLVAPDAILGGATNGSGPRVGLDFLAQTGFGALDLSVWHSRLVAGLFNNGRTGNSAFLETNSFVIGAGQSLDLTQTFLPSILDTATAAQLTSLASGGDVTAVLTPAIPDQAYDRKAATLRLGGLTEFDVLAGGTLTGAAGAQLTAPKIFNAGTIRLAGGSISQKALLPIDLVSGMIGVRDTALGGNGLADVLGGQTANGSFDENALVSAAIFKDSAQTQRVTNGELFTRLETRSGLLAPANQIVTFLGRMGVDEGIRLETGSVTDLSGTTVLNPRAPLLQNGERQVTGKIYAGGNIETAAAFSYTTGDSSGNSLFLTPNYGTNHYRFPASSLATPAQTAGRSFVALPGSQIDISGTSVNFDQLIAEAVYAKALQWSNAGKISVLAGGSIAGSLIDAHGGAAAADGGVLEWLAPRLQQSSANLRADNILFANEIEAAGFDTLIARRSITVEGDATLNLGRSFLLQSAALATPSPSDEAYAVSANVATGTNAVITAPYIRVASLAQSAPSTAITRAGSGALTFNAQAIDLVGASYFFVPTGDATTAPGAVNFTASGDIRLIGVTPYDSVNTRSSLTGQVRSSGNINFTAAQVYATTGTGNLQQLIENQRAGVTGTVSPFLIASENLLGKISFTGVGTAPTAPVSAGSYVRILASEINQNGVLRAPLGLIELGSNAATGATPATQKISFGSNSLTSVSGAGLTVPYGTTTDLTEYFFAPNTNTALSAAPTGVLNLSASAIDITAGAQIDGSGGGDVFAYEFVAGTGGSRDVLDRFNVDIYSGNNGYQFADKRQVYALIPASQAATVAAFDPLYSADYTSGSVDLYGRQAGLSVTLDAAPGIAAGEYLLLPAHYALLPGAMRIVENVGAAAPVTGSGNVLLDGTIVVGGQYSTAGSNRAESTRRSFSVQTKDVFSKYSQIQTTAGIATFAKQAANSDSIAPRSPLDAARVVLSPLASLQVAGSFNFTPATNGRGAQIDIAADNIRITGTPAAATTGVLTLTTDTLTRLNANSLFIGGTRTDLVNGTTSLGVLANQLQVDGNVDFAAPELLLAVAGANSQILISDGAKLAATGTLDDDRTGDYVIPSALAPGANFVGDPDGIGSLLRLATGPERLIERTGDAATRNSLKPSFLTIGTATLTANAMTLDSSRTFLIDPAASLNASKLALSGDTIRFSKGFIRPELEAVFARADQLSLRSTSAIGFSTGVHGFNDLIIDAPGITAVAALGVDAGSSTDSVINARHVVVGNTSKDLGGCRGATFQACGDSFSTLAINASDIRFGSGQFRTFGYDGGVTLSASDGMYVEGVGSFTADNIDDPRSVALTLNSPFLADRAQVADPRLQKIRPDYSFATTGEFLLANPLGRVVTPLGDGAPGSRIAIDLRYSGFAGVTIDNALIRATGGIIDIRADGSIAMTGTASLQTPGYSRRFGDATDSVTVSSSGGTIRMHSLVGSIDTAATSSLIVDTGEGKAGTLELIATEGEITLAAQLNPGIANNVARTASLTLDSAYSPFDFANFIRTNGTKFEGELSIHSGAGDLVLEAGQNVRATKLNLTAEDGSVVIAGSIDTSGDNVAALGLSDPNYVNARVNGGDIALFGEAGVALASTARLTTTTYGYSDALSRGEAVGTLATGYAASDSRQASAGNIIIGIGSETAAISLASGAMLDVSAHRTGDRMLPTIVKDPVTLLETTAFRFVEGDLGGTVNFRAPVIGVNANLVDISNAGTIAGARATSIEGFKRFDLESIASQAKFSGVTMDTRGTIHLDAGASGKPNFLSDLTTSGALPEFIRNFNLAAVNGESLANYDRLRPGIELLAPGSLVLDSKINLGAGAITDYAAAVKAGYLVASPLGLYTSGPLAGTQRYDVVVGQEANLFNQFVNMTYRVGGTSSGEAPVFGIRAGANLDIKNSISDGFFSFHDQTDPAYVSYQLGGGNRSYQPALTFTCGSATEGCTTASLYSAITNGTAPGDTTHTIRIPLATAQKGDDTLRYVDAPYADAANTVTMAGTGNGLDAGELFPLLSDGSAAHSSDIRLVGGAGGISVNPTRVDFATNGSVSMSGESSYAVVAQKGVSGFSGALQLLFRSSGNPTVITNVEDFLGTELLSNIDNADDLFTTLNWGNSTTGMAKDARTAALAFFKGREFTGTKTSINGVNAPLSEILAFLGNDQFGKTYAAGVAANLPGYTAAPLTQSLVNFNQDIAYSPTTVRTGDGAIDLVAANDINLLRTQFVVYRNANGTTQLAKNSTNAQVGGTAVYTAGVRINPDRIPGGAVPASGPFARDYIPGTKGILDAPALYATDGGAVSLTAGNNVNARRDAWSEAFLGTGSSVPALQAALIDGRDTSSIDSTRIGAADQRWRVGSIGSATNIAIAPNLFSSGIGALAGGDVGVRAGNDVKDLTIALDSSLITGSAAAGKTLSTFGAGDLSLSTGHDLAGGSIDVASGAAQIRVDGAVISAGILVGNGDATRGGDTRNLLRLRVSDATVDLAAHGKVDIGAISALGAGSVIDSSAGLFSAIAGVSISTEDEIKIVGNRQSQLNFARDTKADPNVREEGYVLPPSLRLASLSADIGFGDPLLGSVSTPWLLFPSAIGQLSLIAGGNIANVGLAMSDADPNELPGAFSTLLVANGNGFRFPGDRPTYSDALRRTLHNARITHLGDVTPARIFAGNSITNVTLNLPKQARVSAGLDIINLYFEGQNVAASDATRISAGRDITAETRVNDFQQSYVTGNNIVVGGPGALFVEAGRDLGPFLTSATVNLAIGETSYRNVSFAGGIRTIGNESNPWLGSTGAKIYTLFGVGNGVEYAALRETYLNPANAAKLDGDLFEQNTDVNGNKSPDRTRLSYAPVLAVWLRDNAPDAFTAVFGATPPATDAALTSASYAKISDLYAAFTALAPLRQNQFLIDKLYFGELAAPANPNGTSYQQYIRAYRAIETLFPAANGYTDNLATYTTDPATVNADHPLGVPTRKLVDGSAAIATRVSTGNVDLRLATIESARGGDVTILGPGGDFIAGSVVRTSEQLRRKSSAIASPFYAGGIVGTPDAIARINSIPLGFEGILSLRGGAIRTFTDGDFRLNQSRLFTQRGGDIVMFSANGDLNAGQGPKSASNFPPITLRFTQDGFSEADSAGSVAGAGIAAFRPSPEVAAASVTLIAPSGTVDAGDAGVRASGDVFVAAARVANADNFKVGGVSIGVPSVGVAAAPAVPASAAAALTANVFRAGGLADEAADRLSQIIVNVLGYTGNNACPEGQTIAADGSCQPR